MISLCVSCMCVSLCALIGIENCGISFVFDINSLTEKLRTLAIINQNSNHKPHAHTHARMFVRPTTASTLIKKLCGVDMVFCITQKHRSQSIVSRGSYIIFRRTKQCKFFFHVYSNVDSNEIANCSITTILLKRFSIWQIRRCLHRVPFNCCPK